MANEQKIHEVVVLGAGVSGLYQLKRLIDLGVAPIALEADEDLGGTWYRNRYPGARFDSESYTYGYSFSREVLDEWHWKERFSPQPENLRYLNFVADKFDLRRHIRFNARVERMVWDEDKAHWTLHLSTGDTCITRFVVSCIGVLSIPTTPQIEGMDTFKGPAFHTHAWPAEPLPLEGKRVGVVGTGATGIQIISEIADKVDRLTVFQRRPNWSTPLNNAPISETEMQEIRARYDDIFAACKLSPGGFEHSPDRRGFTSLTRKERLEFWNQLYDQPGFALLNANFVETFLDEDANRELSDFVADKIRSRVNDPATAEKLIPKDHGFGMQRLPLETNYFETYNRDNVELVDITETPIERITPDGIETSQAQFDLDIIAYATGFDAITGAFDRIDIKGVDGVSLREKWRHHPATFSGVLTHNFPNFLMVAGPQSVSGSTNYPRAIETGVDWISRLLEHAFANNVTRLEATEEAEREWGAKVVRAQEKMLHHKGRGWFTGYNTNLPGREHGKVRYHAYWGGAPKYAAWIETIAANGYSGIEMRQRR